MRFLCRRLVALIIAPLLFCLVFNAARPVSAAPEPAWQVAAAIEKDLSSAQLALFNGDTAGAGSSVADATQKYNTLFATLAPDQAATIANGTAALQQAASAVTGNDEIGFAAASAAVQTNLYQVGYEETLTTLNSGDLSAAGDWLLLREFRAVKRFERLGGDATQALTDLKAGKIDAASARTAIQADLLDTYQARLTATLNDLESADSRDLKTGRAQDAALAAGYFAILAPTYQDQRGAAELTQTQHIFTNMLAAARSGQKIADYLPQIDSALRSFRAAPLSAEQQNRRANQLLSFTALVPVEYARGVKDGTVTVQLEVQEAATFRDAAESAFSDLRSILETRDSATSGQISAALAALQKQLAATQDGSAIADPQQIQAVADNITAMLKQIMPAEWQTHNSNADFDLIATSLDQMESAVVAGQYEQAESARLQAYAFLESGPEGKLSVFAPQLTTPIESLFWYGTGDKPGLASLISRNASKTTITATRAELDDQLALAQQALTGSNAPGAVVTNAALIVFREGLEAVLILASLLGSMKTGPQRANRRPLWLGTVLALVATALTWLLAQNLLTTLAGFGERLEAVVSLVAIAVLLLITNWFFHDVYWTGWMAGFHRQKKRIIGGAAGQFIGLVMLGITSIYREGFETVLFLQALVLSSAALTVLEGVAIGLGGTVLVGGLVFIVQAKLPHKRMLTFTGVLIGAVLLQMVGNSVHVLQLVGWLPIHPIVWLNDILPFWTGQWLGLYATWEGLLLQFAAAAFTIGSYFLAERAHKRAAQPKNARQAVTQP